MTKLKSKKQITKMRKSGKMLSEVISKVKAKAGPGVTTKDLDSLAERLIREKGATPSFKNYKGFPAAVCTSINNVVVHGVPSDYQLQKDDMLSLDLGLCHNGWHADMATTFVIGKPTKKQKKLMNVTKKSLEKGIMAFKKGNRLGDVGNAIQSYVEKNDLVVVEGLCGHGIGTEVHEDPQVLNTGDKGKGLKIKEGMVICIEPMVTLKDPSIQHTADGIKTRDLSAHFEHMIAIVDGEPKILTK